MPNQDEPFKELIDPLIENIIERKKVFDREYDDSEIYRDLRWQTVLEGIFVDQLEKLTRTATAEQIGEYVLAFYIARDDDGKF